MKADVYWNLHQKCWSIRCGGKVVAHATTVLMADDVTFVVSQKGRERVIREGRKNVHAFARGRVLAMEETGRTDRLPFNDVTLDYLNWVKGLKNRISYNPRTDTSFVSVAANGRKPISGAGSVALIRGFSHSGGIVPKVYGFNLRGETP